MLLEKRYGSFNPSSEEVAEQLLAMPDGLYEVEVSRKRNPQFLRKYHALIDVLFAMWEPQAVDHNGKQAHKNRTRFRKDIAIATGHYEIVVRLDGTARAEATSISFASMGEEEFEMLYSRTIDYALAKVVHGSREQIDNQVAQILDFA